MSEFLNVDQIAEYLGIKKSSIYSKVERKEIPHYKVGNLLRFRKSDIDAWMEEFRVRPMDIPTLAKITQRKKRPETPDKKANDDGIDALVRKAVAESKAIPYTRIKGKPDLIRGLGKGVYDENKRPL